MEWKKGEDGGAYNNRGHNYFDCRHQQNYRSVCILCSSFCFVPAGCEPVWPSGKALGW